MSQQFSEKAGKLLDRINSISFTENNKQRCIESTMSTLNKTQMAKTFLGRPAAASSQTQTVLELAKIEQDLTSNQEQNCRKLKNLNQEIRKLQVYIKEETETRIKVHESFIHSVVKAEKNMQNSVANIRKLHADRERKLQLKIQQVLKQEKKQIMDELSSNSTVDEGIGRLRVSIGSLKQQLVQMKRSRIQLEDKISRQFNDQINDLRAVFNNTIKMREERQMRILEMLKTIYKKHMDSIRKQDADREANQKMFLTVIEQLIHRITQA